MLLARTDGDVPKHRGISYFLLDMATPGIDVRPLRQMTGESHFSEVFLDDVRIPAANLVGGPGEGWRVAQTTLNSERSSIAGGMGATPAALVDLARSFGATADPLVRQRLVDAHIRFELLRFLRYRSQTALSQGRRPGAEASVMKLAFARYMKALTGAAIDATGRPRVAGGRRRVPTAHVAAPLPPLAVAAHRRRQRPGAGQHHGGAGAGAAGRAPRRQGRALP